MYVRGHEGNGSENAFFSFLLLLLLLLPPSVFFSLRFFPLLAAAAASGMDGWMDRLSVGRRLFEELLLLLLLLRSKTPPVESIARLAEALANMLGYSIIFSMTSTFWQSLNQPVK